MIIPGILEQDLKEAHRKIKLIDAISPVIQIDIADGELFDGLTFLDIKEFEKIYTDSSFELHLMVKNPTLFTQKKMKHVSKMLAQVEADNIDKFLVQAKQLGYQVGLSIDADTEATKLDPYIQQLDYVQFMAINTGKSGRPFIPEVLDKIKIFKQNYPHLILQCDGGCNKDTIPLLYHAGISNFSVTSAIFNDPDPISAKLELDALVNTLENPEE